MQLYALASQYLKLLELVDSACDQQMIKDTLEGLKGEIEDKVDGIVKLLIKIEGEEKTIKTEEERLCARRTALKNRRESIKDYLENELVKANLDKVKTVLFTVTIQSNKPSVITDEQNEDLKRYPNLWVKHDPTVDKVKVYELLRNGVIIPGCELRQTKSIRIR